MLKRNHLNAEAERALPPLFWNYLVVKLQTEDSTESVLLLAVTFQK